LKAVGALSLLFIYATSVVLVQYFPLLTSTSAVLPSYCNTCCTNSQP